MCAQDHYIFRDEEIHAQAILQLQDVVDDLYKTNKEEVLAKARETMSEDGVAYVEEDLHSPCTQEIAVFRAFAQIVEKAENEVVVIDTALTGHTLLLLDSTHSYHREYSAHRAKFPSR